MRTLLVFTVLLAAAAADAVAQTRPVPPPGGRDFLFGAPNGSVAVRGGWVLAGAGSDIFSFVERELTIDKDDFNTYSLGGDIAFALSPRVDIVAGADWQRVAIDSEYRDFVDNDRLPIEQRTSLQQMNLTGSIRFALASKGREISNLAWVPRSVVPYVGVGGGAMWYEFKQAGDFIDALDPPPQAIFSDVFTSKGWTPSAHVFGGVDLKLYRQWYLTLDGRYVWADADLGSDFDGFEPIDLSGFRFGAGINVLF